MMTEEVKIAVRKLESFMKAQILAAVVLLTPIASAAQKAPEPPPVPVAVIVQTSQFEDQAQKDRLDSANDLTKKLRSFAKKTVLVVETPADAAVVIEVLGRGPLTLDTKTIQPTFGGTSIEQKSDIAYVLRVKLSVGEYSTEIEGRSTGSLRSWGDAASVAQSKISDWIKTNRAKLP
jgi:hypothetical protein